MPTEKTMFHLLECICVHTKDYRRGRGGVGGLSIVTVVMCLSIHSSRQQ